MRRMVKGGCWAILAIGVAAGAPAQSTDVQTQRQEAELRALQESLVREAQTLRSLGVASRLALESTVALQSRRAMDVARRLREVERVQARSLQQGVRSELQAAEQALRVRGMVRGVGAASRAQTIEARARLRDVERELARVSRGIGDGVGSVDVDGLELSAPAAWLPQDPADSLYRAAREQLSARRYAAAVEAFMTIIGDYPRSGYVGDAHYFAALARTRLGGRAQLMEAAELLAAMETRYAQAATAADARALRVRIEGQLAARGDARAAQSVMGIARGSGSAGSGGQVACDEDEQALRATALSALLQMDPDRARPILMEVLASRDRCTSELRAQAIFILAQEADTDDAELVALLVDLAVNEPDPDPEVREAAVFWLAQSESDAAVDALLEILRSADSSEEMAEHALFALGQNGNSRAMAALREFARSEDTELELRANAIYWLAHEGDAESAAFLRSLYSSLDDSELKERVFFAIAESDADDGREWLTARALDPNESVEVRTMALFWAGEAGMSSDEVLQIYRTAEDPELREQAIFVLTQVADDAEAVDALMEVARSEENPELRQRAIFWLGESDDPRVPEFLMEILRGGGGA